VALSKSRVAKLVNPLFQMGIAKDPATKVQVKYNGIGIISNACLIIRVPSFPPGSLLV
jgi:hypothetical protein